MKKIMTYLITLNAFLIFGASSVNAECTYTQKAELNKKVANVKIDYEVYVDKINSKDAGIELMDGERELLRPKSKLSFYNIDSELYVEGTDSVSGEKITKTAADMKDGVSTVSYEDASAVRKFTFKVFASDSSSCPGEALKTIYVTIPRFNEHSKMMYCQDSDFYLCKEFVTTDELTEEDFMKKLTNYEEGIINEDGEKVADNNKNWFDKTLGIVTEYKYFIAGGTLAIIGIIVIIRRIKTKKQRELGL